MLQISTSVALFIHTTIDNPGTVMLVDDDTAGRIWQVVVSGQLPMANGALLATGPVPSKVSIEDAQKAAKQCALNGLAVIADQLGGDLSQVKRIVRLGVFVQSDDRFDGQPKIANGASELMQEIFGEAGRHARAAVGTNALPLDATVEIEFLVEVSG